MNHLAKFKQSIGAFIAIALLICTILSVIAYFVTFKLSGASTIASIIVAAILYICTSTAAISIIINIATGPLNVIWQAVWHISPHSAELEAPNIDDLKTGKDLVYALVTEIYNIASTSAVNTQKDDEIRILNTVPAAILTINKESIVNFANKTLCQYLELETTEIIGKDINDILNLSFTSEDTLKKWLKSVKETKPTDIRSWENVKLNLTNGNTERFDIGAYFSKDDPNEYETTIILFEKTGIYSIQDQATNYVSMAVHELRTPLTMLRGYIELFEEEIGANLSEEHQSFMHKMSATSQNLTSIVSNILNVSRIDENEFKLTLREANWETTVKEIIDGIDLRAKVKNKTITTEIEPNLPTVGIDKISIYEVLVNLIDNAIKYSGASHEIKITAKLNKEGVVETSVIDKGPGMPANVVGGLFTKFYRSHRSKDNVGGSGLGLYIVKSIIDAHGGSVWVNSKEGKGSQFGFTVLPYANLEEEQRRNGNDGIVRQANGWIKNHSLYRR